MTINSVVAGRFTYGHKKIRIRTWGEGHQLKLGSFCSIAPNVTVYLGGNHRVDWVTTFPFGHIFQDSLGGENIVGHPSSNGDVVVGNDVWIGSGATLMSGVSIGNGAVIAANAHVVSDVEPYAIVGGNPAKHLKFRFDKEIRNLLLELRWWDLDEATIREIAPEISQPPEVQTLRNLIERHAGAN